MAIRPSATAALHSTPSTKVHPEGIQNGETKILILDVLRCHERNDFNEPRLLHLPVYRKALNFLTSDAWFSFINIYLLMFQLPGLCCKTPIYPGPSLNFNFRAVLRAESLLHRLKSSTSLLDKT